jgi:hypothetical protein
MTYKASVSSVFNFGAGIYYPNCKPTNVACFQVLQNAALRLATGCHKAATVAHLHAEAKMLPVAKHLLMLCRQFLVSCMCPGHPSHAVVQIPPGPRKNAKGCPLKETLSSRFGDALAPHLHGGIVPGPLYNKVKEEIYTKAVKDYLASAPPNKVLDVKPPTYIHPSEQTLPRAVQTTLSQLRSGSCSALQSYKHYIKQTNDDIGPCRKNASHTTAHLFSCASHPTTLTFLDLWRKPVEVPTLISTQPSFNHLQPLVIRLL